MANDTTNGGLDQLEQHYATFIVSLTYHKRIYLFTSTPQTEEDFAQIAGAGLNWIRLPIPFWAVQSYNTEPFLERVSWKYILKAFAWARKYGIRINLDLHAVPGSQNAFNHSGKQGQVNFLYGPMGLANGQRTLDYLRVITEFIAQPQYANVVPMLGFVNGPVSSQIGDDVMTAL
jgi:glucan 1,3-beta-glucosidase